MQTLMSREFLQQWAPVLVLIALVALLTLIEPRFFSVRNFARIGISSAPALMVAVGVTFIILMGSIDLSMEGTVAVSAVVFAYVFLALGGTAAGAGILAIPLALGIGAFCGFLNGLTHVRLKIPSFMASLSMGFVGIGVAMMLTGGDRIRIEDPVFRSLLTERIAGFPLMVWLALAALGVAFFIQRNTAIGRNFYAIGGGEELAHASGVKVNRVRIIAFTLAGVFYALGALFAVARLGIAETATGFNLMFVSITSVVVGGTLLWGGAGGVLNSLVGVLIVNVINNGMIIVGLPRYIQDGVLGLMVIAAVILSTDRQKLAFVK
jgi:ribose transport system permease protein